MLVGEIINDVRDYLGQCATATLYSRLTDAVNVLALKGEWDQLVGYVDICATSDGTTVTLPRDIDTPLAVMVSGQPVYFRNRWFEFHLNGNLGRETPWTWDDRGDFPVFMDILQASFLVAVANLKTDLNASIRIFGYDQNGQWLRTQNPDGSFTDGFLLPVNIFSDFPMGLITPSVTVPFIRNMTVGPIQEFLAIAPPDQFVTGELITLGLVGGVMPTPLKAGTSYYVEAVDVNCVRLYTTRSAALTQQSPINLTAATAAATLSMTDTRIVAVQTKFNTGFAPHNLANGLPISFTGSPLPSPIVALGVNGVGQYYSFVLDNTNFTAHTTINDALTGVNPVDVNSPGTNVMVAGLQTATPTTIINFGSPHNMIQGDAVFAATSGGTLPAPLIPGVAYFVHYLTPNTLSLHASLADATAGTNAIVMTTAGSGSNSIFKNLQASISVGNPGVLTVVNHPFGAGDLFSLTTSGTMPTSVPQLAVTTNYKVGAPITFSTFIPQVIGTPQIATASRSRAANVSTIVTGLAHGFTTGDFVDISGMTDATFNATHVICTVVNGTTFTYANSGANVGSIADLAGLVNESPDFNVTSGGTGQLFVVVSRVFNVLADNGFTTLTASLPSGTVVGVGTTGTLPAANPALSTAGTYYTRTMSTNRIQLYDTAAHANDVQVRVSVSRARAANAATIFTSGNHNLVTGDFVDITGLSGTGYNGNRNLVTVTNATTFTYASTGTNEGTAVDAGGLISASPIDIFGLGAGVMSLVFNRSVAAQLRTTVIGEIPLLAISPNDFMQQMVTVQFTSNGTLPAPLVPMTNYQAFIEEGQLKIFDMANNPITIANIGSGSHALVIARNFNVNIPTNFDVPLNVYNNGDAVVVQAAAGVLSTAPLPLVYGTTYYARRIDDNTVELYDTSTNALNILATTGRIVPISIGSGQTVFTQTINAPQVSRVTRVAKSPSNGFIDVYALDPGRAHALTLIGHYYPDETEPSYRRIKVGCSCSWIRMRYRKRVFKITSDQDWIPLTSKMAVLMMVRSLELMRDNFFTEAKNYEQQALAFLLEEQRARGGPDVVSIQINADTFTNPYDQWMD